MKGFCGSRAVTVFSVQQSGSKRNGLSGVLQKGAGESGERRPVAQCEQVQPLRCPLATVAYEVIPIKVSTEFSSPTMGDGGRRQESHRTRSVFECRLRR
jgi:hypothetical protein